MHFFSCGREGVSLVGGRSAFVKGRNPPLQKFIIASSLQNTDRQGVLPVGGVVPPDGFEPPTPGLGNLRSIL